MKIYPKVISLTKWFIVTLWLVFVFWWRPDKGIKKQGLDAESEIALLTKSHQREPESEKERRAKNPREVSDEARKRGLSEDEVRGIVEEYFKVVSFKDQPERPVEEILNQLRLARLRLYLDVLSEGLHLSQEQIAKVEEQLPSLASEQVVRIILLAEVDRAWELSVPPEGAVVTEPGSSGLSRLEQIETVAKSPISLANLKKSLRPWDLCELSEDQKQLLGYENDKGDWIWVDGRESTLDYSMNQSYERFADPFDDGSVISWAGVVFPLSMGQVNRFADFERESGLLHKLNEKHGVELERVKLLTRSQLQTLLLFNPEMAEKLNIALGE